MQILVDVGNTRLKWALYAAPVPGAGMVAHGAVFLEAIDQLAEGRALAHAGEPLVEVQPRRLVLDIIDRQ